MQWPDADVCVQDHGKPWSLQHKHTIFSQKELQADMQTIVLSGC